MRWLRAARRARAPSAPWPTTRCRCALRARAGSPVYGRRGAARAVGPARAAGGARRRRWSRSRGPPARVGAPGPLCDRRACRGRAPGQPARGGGRARGAALEPAASSARAPRSRRPRATSRAPGRAARRRDAAGGVVRRRADGPRPGGAVGARGGAARGVSNAAFILPGKRRRRREGERHEFTRRCYRQPPGRPIGERAG